MFNIYLSPEDQLTELRDKGLIIDDEEEAKLFISLNDVHRLEGYLPAFMANGSFIPGISFRALKETYLFDQELRHRLSLYLEMIELRLKHAYCQEFSKTHGESDYLDPAFFTDPAKHKEIMDKADNQRKSLSKHDSSFAYAADDGSPIDLPIWKFVELLTIKDITDLYLCSRKSLKKRIALSFGLTMKERGMVLGHSMRRLTFLRNMCAHNRRLYNRVFVPMPSLNKKEKRLLARKADGSLMDSHLFGYILMVRRLSTKEDFQNFKNDLVFLKKEYPSVDMEHYGFPANWEKVL